MEVIQVSKVYHAGRVALGEVAKFIGADVGDYIQFFLHEDCICIQKVSPSIEAEGP